LRTWAFSLLLTLHSALGASSLRIDIWTWDCCGVTQGQAEAALKTAALILKPCGISLKKGSFKALATGLKDCHLPMDEAQRAPILKRLSQAPRQLNPKGLSLFLIGDQDHAGDGERYSFSVVEKSKGAGCGDPESRFLENFGSLYMTEFAFASPEKDFAGLLLAHEIMHELTQRSHPTHAPRGSLLADHLPDLGPKILAQDCACMSQSPYLLP
jgi:hypothetical protein